MSNKSRAVYFEEEDVLHIVFVEGDEEASVELSPNVTVELDRNDAVIGVEILDLHALLSGTEGPLGQQLRQLRQQIIDSGIPLLDQDEIEREINDGRGNQEEQD